MNILLFTLLLSLSTHQQQPKRSLLLFGKTQAGFKEQLLLLSEDSVGMNERDLVISIIEKETDYKKHNATPGQFTLLLIGKDGGEKLRSNKPVRIETIFRLIDSMPMRQAEMKREKN